MAKHAAVEFDRKLDRLFRERTRWLRAEVRKPTGRKPPTFGRRKVDQAIAKLLELAIECLLRPYAIREFKRLYDLKKQWHVTKSKGWGRDKKRRAFRRWFESRIPYENCVYVFWARRRCRYIGRTTGGKNRPQGHFDKHWFSDVTRVDIYACKRSRDIPQIECLATHRFRPSYLRNKPAKRKWYKRCPICETRKRIKQEVHSVFRLK